MGTVLQRFFPDTVNWDGTDPASGDVRKLLTAVPGAVNTTTCDFGTSGAKTITCDPYTGGRTTTGLTSAFGWAVNIAGADGMDSTATAKRVIPAGTWFLQGTLQADPVASLAACTIGFNVYRVAASPSTTRTLLFSDSFDAGLIAAAATNYSRTTPSQAEIVLEADETIQITYTLTCTGQVGGLVITFRTGEAGAFNDCFVDVPTPGIRTRYLRDFTGSSTPAGAIVRNPTRTFTGSTTPTGVIVRKPSIFKTGATTPTGAVRRTPSKFFTGATTPTGAVLRRPTKPLTATITPGPSTIVRKPTKLLTATITPAATVTKFIKRFLTGTITPTGVALKRPSIFATGSITPGPGTVTRRPTKLLTASTSPTGSLVTLITKNLAGMITPVGALIRKVSKSFTGSTTPAGSLAKTPKKFFTGTIGTQTEGSTIIRRVLRIFDD